MSDSEPRVFTRRERVVPYLTRARDDLHEGDRVALNVPLFRGQTGTLVREARLLNGKPAWLVKMDDPRALWRGRMRVAERSLIKA